MTVFVLKVAAFCIRKWNWWEWWEWTKSVKFLACITEWGERRSIVPVIILCGFIPLIFLHPAGEGPVCVEFTCSPHSFLCSTLYDTLYDKWVIVDYCFFFIFSQVDISTFLACILSRGIRGIFHSFLRIFTSQKVIIICNVGVISYKNNDSIVLL